MVSRGQPGAKFQIRPRALPDVSRRAPAPPARLNTALRDAVDAFMQTPESWQRVWDED